MPKEPNSLWLLHETSQRLLLAAMVKLDPEFIFTSSEQAWAWLLLSLEVRQVRSFLKSWKTSNSFQKNVEEIVTVFRRRKQGFLDRQACYRFNLDLMLEAESLRQAEGLEVDFDRIRQTYHSLAIHDKREILVTAFDLHLCACVRKSHKRIVSFVRTHRASRCHMVGKRRQDKGLF